jgi:hypothetical protein
MDELFAVDRNKTVISGLVVLNREASFLFFEDESATEVFIPKSVIDDWWFVDNHDKKGLRLEDLRKNDEISLVIPKWLALKENLI